MVRAGLPIQGRAGEEGGPSICRGWQRVFCGISVRGSVVNPYADVPAFLRRAAMTPPRPNASSRPNDSEVEASGMGADRKFGPKNPGSEPASVLPGKVSVEEET